MAMRWKRPAPPFLFFPIENGVNRNISPSLRLPISNVDIARDSFYEITQKRERQERKKSL